MSSFEDYRKRLSDKYGTTKKEEETKEEKKVDGSSVWDDSFESYRRRMNTKYGFDIDSAGVKSWFDEGEKTIKGLSDYYKANEGKWVSNYGADFTDSIANLRSKANAVSYYLRNHRSEFADYASLSKAFSEYSKYLDDAERQNTSLRDFYSQFANEREYNTWYDDYKRGQEYQSATEAEDFMKYSQIGANIKNPTAKEAEPDVILFGQPIGGKEVGNVVTYSIENKNELALGEANGGGSYAGGKYLYSFMKEDEVAIYNYYLGKGDTKKAAEYLAYLEPTLNKRLGGQVADSIDDTLLEVFNSGLAGIEQAALGFRNIGNFITGTEGEAITSTQYAHGLMSENNKGIWKVTNDLANTTGNMLPSILVGSMTGGLGGAATLGVSAMGNAYSEMRKLGYDEWQSRGYAALTGASEAVLSYALSGISQLGGGNNGIFQTIASKIIPSLDKAAARVAIEVGGNMLDEGLEEMIQEVLDPVFKMVATGEDFEGIDLENVLYSGLLGALSAGMLEGVPTIAGSIDSNYQTYKQMGGMSNTEVIKSVFEKGFGEVKKAYNQGKQTVNEMAGYHVNEALEIDPDNAHAQRMQTRLNEGKDVSGYQINRLIEANENAMVSQDKGKIQKAAEARLSELGETGNVSAITDVLVKYATGEKLTSKDWSILNKSKAGHQVATELNGDNLKSGGLANDWAADIGTERIGADVYNRSGEQSTLQPGGKMSTNIIPPDDEGKTIEQRFAVSENGNTTLNGETVSIKEVASIKDGDITLRLENGDTVSANDVEFSSSDEMLYATVVDMNLNAETANAFIRGFNAADGLSAGQYALGFREAYRYGSYGFPVQEMSRDGFSATLSETQKNLAYNLGKVDAKYAIESKQNAVKNAKVTNKLHKDSISIEEAESLSGLTDRQKTSIRAMKALSKALGLKVRFFESPTDAKGNRLGENGRYDPATGILYIDLYAGFKGEGAILFTAGHELTHFIRQWSPAKFKVFADTLLEHYGKKGEPVDALVRKQIQKAKDKDRDISYDEAYEEVIADSCEAMLADGEAFSMISAKIKAKDKGLWNKIKDFFKNLVAKIKEAYTGLKPDSKEGRMVSKMLETTEQLKDLWIDALVDASANYGVVNEQFSTDNIRGNAEGAVVKSEVTDALVNSMAKGDVLLSERTEYEALPKQTMSLSTGAGTILYIIEGLTPTKVKGLTDKGINGYTGRAVREFAMKNNGFTKAQIAEVNKFMDSMADFMKEAGVTYRFIGLQDVENAQLHYSYNTDGSIKSIVLSAMVKNGDYPVNFDLSSICKKRVAMSALIDKLAKRGTIDNGTVKLTPANIFKINTALKDAGYETACLGCFVESKRYNSLEWAKKFCDKWNAAVKKVNPNATYFGYGNATFNEDSFTLEQAIKIDEAANKYIKATKTERLANALAKYKAKEKAGQPLVAGKVMKVDGKELYTFSKAARDRLMKSDTISEELKTKYLTCDVSTLNIADVEFLLENGILPGASLSNKQAVTEMVKSGEAYQHLLRPSDLLTDRGISKLEALPNFHGVLYGHYGSGTPKLMQSYTPYNSEIALLPTHKNSEQTLAEYLYTIAGVRMQSFSDFQIQNIYDYLQVVADLAARKVPAHAYTKEISFAKLLGMTGIKVNLSVMFDIDPMVDKAHAGLIKLNPLIHKGEYAKVVLEDAQGKWVYNIGDYQTQKMFEEAFPDEAKRFLQSIGFADAVKLQSSNGYSSNCGIIGVGYSDLGIFAMLDDNRIRYIIPYHASSLPADIKVATNIELGTDYTPYQNNMKIEGIVDRNGNKVNWTIKEAYKRLGSGQAVIDELNNNIRNKGWVVTTKKAQTGHGTYGLYEDLQQTNDPRQTASNFIDWCIGNSTLPLFYQFASHNNYYKLLYDYNVYDCVTEEYAPQQAVTNTYPTMVDGQVQPGNVTDGGFNTEYLQETIDKQMAFMDKYSRDLDADLDKLADNMEKGNYSLQESLKDKFKFSDRVLMGSLFSGGGTLEAGLVYQMVDKEFAVEYNKKIASVYTDNHGKEHMFVGDVRDFNSKEKQNVFYLHASPVCKNFSPASHSGGETSLDITTAQATVRVLEEQMPQVFTVENVKRYIGSEAYNIITNKLDELGYTWDVDVYKASDYGNATKRERMIIRAVRDGQLPAKPQKVSNITSWGEATRDLWETDLIPSTLVKSKIDAIKNTPELKNLKLTKLDKPLMIYDTTKSKKITYAWADELAPTLTTKCGDARIIMPDGRVYAPTPKFMGRIQGLPDNYKYPKANTNAFKIIGNGIPTQLTKAVMGGVLDSAYEQTHDGQVLYSDRNTASFNGKAFWSGSVSLLDGVIEEVHSFSEAEDADFHHSMYFSSAQIEKMDNGENAFFFVDNGEVHGDWRVSIPDDIIGRIKEQIVFAPSNPEAREFSDADIKYSIREEAPPKKTIEGYKVFVVKNGKLYPPMVANPNAEDTPVGVWLNADVGTRAPDSKTGRMQVKAGGKGTQGGSGSLAFRPGWHLGETPLATQFDRLNPETGVKELFPENFVWALCDIAADHDYQEEAMSYGYTKNGKFQHSLAGLPKLPTDGYYKYRTNPNPDTVPWLITGAMKVKRLLSDAEVNAILEEKGLSPKQRVGGNKTLADLGLAEYEGVVYSERDTDSYSNRSLLAGALETAVQNDIERQKLAQYKEKINLINAEEQKLHGLREQIKELSFAKGPRDTQAIKSLQFEANQIANRINTYDRQLLNLESTKALKGVLEREKAKARKKAEQDGREALDRYRERAAKTQRELLTRYQESRKKAIEGRNKTEIRHKIKKVVLELNTLLLKPTAKKHIKEELRKEVADALSAINMDTVGADERVAKYNYLIAKESDPDVIAELTKTRDNIQLQGERLKEKLDRLQSAYDKIKNTDDIELNLAYQEVIHNSIKAVAEKVGNTSIRNMTLEQLEMVYDLFTMIHTTIRKANESFKNNKGQTIMQMAEAVNNQVRTVGGQPYKRNAISAEIQRMGWTFLKPYVAFRTIGSVTLTNMYKELRNGEDTFYNDVKEAQAFIEAQYEKHNYKSWDMKKTKTFTAKSGKRFDLTLEQMMTLYAYSKREQAHKHIIEGGIVFEDALITEKNKWGVPIKYEVTTKDAFNLSEETFSEIANSLTAEQKAFVDAMQAYLSDNMGAKGNEVSMELLGVKLFKEEFYLPIKSSQYYMNFKADEAGEVKLKSPAFSKETVTHANNPIVLHSFTDLWAEHINDMSMYHSFVLALEDFTRVYNYKTKTDAKVETMDTKATLETAYPGVTNYISKFLKDMNGGVRAETVGWAERLTSLSKKGAVLGSWSVTIQQPSAVMRAMAYISPKYFVATALESINLTKHKQDWAELKKYAAIAGIKEMGRFDVGMGQATVDWIKSNKTVLEKAEDIASLPPAFMDEVTWVSIWNAVKRETLSKYKNLSPKSEEFLKAAGERFTEVVSLSQVYDSVFSRSDLMRNKSWIAKALTAFMAEPTTTLNMIWDSWVHAKRNGTTKGYVKAATTTGGAIVSAAVLNAALKSIIMAMRDDDEDEAYAEKYLEHFVGELKDSLNPLTLVPFAKDIVSIFKGYDVERMDMALFSDFKNAIDAFNSDNKTLYEKWSGLIGATSAFFGVPIKNVERDVRGLITTFFGKTEDATVMGILNAIKEGWTGKEISNGQQLYEAMLKGDSAQIERIKGRFEEQKDINSAIRKALRDNDPRIKEAAEARYNGDITEYTRIVKEIIDEGHFKQDDIVAAINSEINALKKGEGETSASTSSDSAVSLYSIGDYYSALKKGASATANAVKEDLIQTGIANGKDRDEAEESFNSSFRSYVGKMYKEGEISNTTASNMLINYGGYDSNEAYWKLKEWDFKKVNGEDASYSKYTDFYEAVKTGSSLKAVIAEYTSHGVEKKTLASQITSYFKPLYIQMANSERARIKGYLLNAYALLGYIRSEKSKDIDKWLKS